MNKAFKNEYIICSAIYYPNNIKYEGMPLNIETGFVSLGYRHYNCRFELVDKFYPNWKNELELPYEEQDRLKVLRTEIQGFITNKNRFVDRVEGKKIAVSADQILEERLPMLGDKLYSEDIY